MAHVEWTGMRTRDPDTNATVLQAKVNGHSVSAYISEEAIQDFGIDAARTVAETKIAAEMQGDIPPTKVTVRTSDFR